MGLTGVRLEIGQGCLRLSFVCDSVLEVFTSALTQGKKDISIGKTLVQFSLFTDDISEYVKNSMESSKSIVQLTRYFVRPQDTQAILKN